MVVYSVVVKGDAMVNHNRGGLSTGFFVIIIRTVVDNYCCVGLLIYLDSYHIYCG